MLHRVLFLVSLLVAAPLFALDLYISPQGNDAWSGRLAEPNAGKTDGPFATLGRARDEMRRAHPPGSPPEPKTVHLRAGTYAVTDTLKLEGHDSGRPEAPVVWRAFEKERALLVGGRAITGFKPWKGEIMQADVGAQGFRDVYFRQLFFAGERQTLARYPNADLGNPIAGGWAYAEGDDWPLYEDKPGESRRELVYKAADARVWSRPTEVELFIFPRFNWWNDLRQVQSIDPAKRLVTVGRDHSFAVRGGDRYFFQNALEELDAPGEWYLDRETWTLYFWPPAPLANGQVFAPTTRTILRLDGVQHVTFRGLALECSEGDAVILNGCTKALIEGCTIRNIGDFDGSGVAINGGTGNGVSGCDISFTGRHAIQLSGGDRPTLTPAGNFADNNYLHHFGVFYKQGVGVDLEGVGNRVTHNLMHDGPRFAIRHGGNNNVIEFNRLRHIGLETEDVGAIYSGGRDWLTPRGTAIRYNFISDVAGFGHAQGKWVTPYFAWGVYLDDNTGGVDVIGNIVARCGRGGLHCHSGRDNHVENNVWIDNGQWQVDFHGWKAPDGMWGQHFPEMLKGYESVAGQPAWKTMRAMEVHPRDAIFEGGLVISGNRFLRNIIAYRDPEARAIDTVNLPPGKNVFDHNLVWNHGHPPRTGIVRGGAPVGENLAPNPRFADDTPGAIPKHWNWQNKPVESARAELVELDGRKALRIDGALRATGQPWERVPILSTSQFPLTAGRYYRLRAKVKATQPGARAALMLQSYKDKTYFWASYPGDFTAGVNWTDLDLVVKTPAPGEKNHHPEMKSFNLRLEFKEAAGALFITDLEVREVAMLTEWQAWQSLGYDTHSQIADPKFIAPERDDYRLAPDSPALALGFQPIPVEKIGPYQSDTRASWPITEAKGARENPLVIPASGK